MGQKTAIFFALIFLCLWVSILSEVYKPYMYVYNVVYVKTIQSYKPYGHGGWMICDYKGRPDLGFYKVPDDYKPKPRIVRYEFPNDNLRDIRAQLEDGIICGIYFTGDMCEYIEYSTTCDVRIKICTRQPARDFLCDISTFRINRFKENQLPPPHLRKKTIIRLNRSAPFKPCVAPLETETYYTVCLDEKSSSKRVCAQKCKRGHSFDEGNTRYLTCNFDEGLWRPRDFQECPSLIKDCGIVLISDGKMECTSSPPKCYVTCYKTMEKEESRDIMRCSPGGEWKDHLPFCVSLNVEGQTGASIKNEI